MHGTGVLASRALWHRVKRPSVTTGSYVVWGHWGHLVSAGKVAVAEQALELVLVPMQTQLVGGLIYPNPENDGSGVWLIEALGSSGV